MNALKSELVGQRAYPLPYVRMVKTTVYLPDTLRSRLKQVAAQQGTSEAELIRTAVDEYTSTRHRPKPALPLFEGTDGRDIAEHLDEMMEGFGQD